MPLHFDPRKFPERVIFVDTTTLPPTEKMNCLGCGRLTETLWKNDELCYSCYEKWSARVARAWVKTRF
jgi:hypothetical protein